ncbi:MAG: hypothetical protein ACAI43_12585 [Phycisphaerae bacterium]|nr:hypothetical protein [Tepidisphaeraceae bacterium]
MPHRFVMILVAVVLAAVSGRSDAADAKRPRKEYASPQEMLNAVPPEVMPLPKGKWTAVQIEATNAKLKASVVGQPASISFKVRTIDKTGDGRRRIIAEKIDVRGEATFQHAYFTEDKVALLAKVKAGEVIRVTGTVSGCYIDSKGPFFQVVLSDCALPNK